MNKRIKKKREKNRINEYAELLRGVEVSTEEPVSEEVSAKAPVPDEVSTEAPVSEEIFAEEAVLEEAEEPVELALEAAEIEEILLEDLRKKNAKDLDYANEDEALKIKKNRHRAQNCILFIGVGLTMLAMMIYGFAEAWFGPYTFDIALDRPVFVSFLLGEIDIPELETEQESEVDYALELMAEEEMSSEEGTSLEESEATEPETTEEEGPIISDKLAAEYLEYYGEVPFTIGDDVITHYVSWNDNKSHSMYYTSPGVRAVSSVYDYKQVDESYFDNSVIIGDSRIEGLHEYSGWSNATFLYKRGLTVYAMMSKEVQLDRSRRSTVLQTLSERQFENVYIMVGINELGGGTDEKFAEQYRENIEKIRELQPNARIIIMSIMFETREYSDSKPVYNNDNVNAKNVAIAKLANGEDIFYLDVNPCIADPETGVMPESYSFDGVHMKAQYYTYWVDYMYAHGY